jgi:hypothetical protein
VTIDAPLPAELGEFLEGLGRSRCRLGRIDASDLLNCDFLPADFRAAAPKRPFFACCAAAVLAVAMPLAYGQSAPAPAQPAQPNRASQPAPAQPAQAQPAQAPGSTAAGHRRAGQNEAPTIKVQANEVT